MKALLFVASVLLASCSVNQYCLNCEKGDGGAGDGGGDGNDSGSGSGSDGGNCTQTNGGVEICDGIDNDCNGTIDDNVQELGKACNNLGHVAQPGDPALTGECVGSKVISCNSATQHVVCDHPPMPEVCDLKDNNCDGQKDEGDPGGGVACGTNAGECTAGVMHCNKATGIVECQGAIGTVGGQPEICDGKDNDCNGMTDDGLGSLGTCGGPNTGLCHTGTLMCMGGGTICIGSQGPALEICDNMDNDCDGVIDNGFDKNTDPRNCGSCNHVCSSPHAASGCSPGGCTIANCDTGFHDIDNPSPPLADLDGCEYACLANGTEVCDGVDNDCDGNVDNGLTAPPGLCNQTGLCSGAVAMCTGAGGWVCQYPAGVTVDASGNIVPETKCDGLDNDCDGKTDENQPNLLTDCHDSGVGVCQGSGKFQCNAANLNGPAVCVITTPGGTASAETCDGKDNDCNGIVDDGAATGNMPGQEWVTIPNSATQIMKYEASRPDSSTTAQGISTATTCSRAGVLPWTNVKYPDAVNACLGVGGRICTENEWEQMCAVETYPETAPTGSAFLTIQAEDAFANTNGTGPRTWIADTATAGSTGHGAMLASTNGGTSNNAATAATASPHLDFKIDFGATPTTYVIWARVFSPGGNDNQTWLAVPGFAFFDLASSTGSVWNWQGAVYANLSGVQTVSLYMHEDGARVDAISITQATGIQPPLPTEWAFQNNPHTFQTGVCNSQELDTDAATTGNQDDILTTGHQPACFANGPGGNDAYDMSGNVKEWTKARATNQNPIRGGASNSTPDGISCELGFTLADNAFFFPNVGFRCCR